MSNTVTAEKLELPYVSWDTCTIAEGQAKWLIECAKEAGETLDEKKAFQQACEDSDLYAREWDDMCSSLTELMQRISPDYDYWAVRVTNFGWRKLDGYKEFRAEDGKKLLQEILPKTDCTFEIYDQGDSIRLANRHHDSPCGGESYTIEVNRKWVIKSLDKFNEDSGEALYWAGGDWANRDLATRFMDREKSNVNMPRDDDGDIAGEWEEMEE